MGAISPYLYSAPSGLVEYQKTAYVTDPLTGVTTGGNVIYQTQAASSQPAVYVAPAYVPTPACTQANGGAYVSSECVDLALAAEQLRMKLATQANYAVFLQNCLNTFPQPTNCYERTYGLTLPGTTGSANPAILLPNASTILGTGQQPTGGLVCQPGWHKNAAGNGCDIDVAPKTPVTPPPPKTPATTPIIPKTITNYVDEATSFFEDTVPVAGHDIPFWAFAAAGVAALFLLKGGR